MAAVRAVLLTLLLCLVASCNRAAMGPVDSAPPPDAVSGHTDGTVPRAAPIRVQLTRDLVAADVVGQPAIRSPFSLDPHVAGTAVWTTRREIAFVPDRGLPAGRRIAVTFDLGAVDPQWSGRRFRFEIAVLRQSYRSELHGLEAADATGAEQRLTGVFTTADTADPEAVEATLTAEHAGVERAVTWSHDGDGRTHAFTVLELRRAEEATELVLTFDGEPIGVETDSREVVAVPAIGHFALASARTLTGADQGIDLRFTDPLAPNQDLAGLVRIDGKSDLRFDVDGSVVRITSASGWTGVARIVATGIRNAAGRVLPGEQSAEVSFEPLQPAVRFAGDGVVYPTTAGLTVPIEVVNVAAVTVSATQVFEATVPQFLQVNTLEQDGELHRVGREVWSQRLAIPQTPDRQDRWVRVGLDVTSLVADHPGGLYRLELSFDRPDIVWACATRDPVPRIERPDGEASYWDAWGEEDPNDPSSAYEHRHDPCATAYYYKWYDREPRATRNVLVSNIGLVAKRGEDRELVVVATDLRSAAALSGVDVTVLDFQQQPIAEGKTGADGLLRFTVDRRPFLLVGRAGGQSSFLKLDDGAALATSHFDTSGAAVKDGLKGFFYAERGVWRPGDDIHLTFVLYDEAGTLPADHPIHFELRSPTGVVADRRTVTTHSGPFWPLPTRTASDAPTGTWTALVQVGGRSFTQPLRLETVIPNRLKIDLDFGTEMLRGPDPAIDASLASRWLHGAVAPGLEARVEVELAPRPTAFASFPDHTFDDPTASFTAEPVAVFDGRLDETGTAKVGAPIHVPANAPGLLTASFTTRVFEPSGAASIDRHAIPLSPHRRYVGIRVPKGDEARKMLLTDVEHPVEIVTVDPDGRPTGDGSVRLRLYEIDWRWWWEGGGDDLAEYAGTTSHHPIEEATVALKDGRATWGMTVRYPAWGRYLLVAEDVDGTHRAGRIVYIDWPGWAGRGQKDNPGGAAVLSVTASDKAVEVGRAVTVHVPTAAGGRALVSLETGTKVLRTEWVEPTGATTPYTFTATPDMAPSVYAHVTLVQPHLAAQNDLPIRLYGIVPIEVYDPATRLLPRIVTADVLEPEATAIVRVSEEKGRPMTYTLAVVDEGLLGLTRFETPDPWDAFYRREALGVKTWDLYGHVAGGHGGPLEEMLAIGGDAVEELAPPAKANRFPPVVRVMGPYTLAAGETDARGVALPPYVGEVRIMVVAGHDGAFGSAHKSVPVRKPLMVLATLPRVLGPGESLSLPVAVFALEDKVKSVDLTVDVDGPLSVVGDPSRTLAFAAPGDRIASIPLKVADAVGVARVHVRAEGGGERAEQVIEIDVRHPGAVDRRAVAATVAPGATATAALEPFGIAGTSTAVLELSRIPPLELGRRLDELVRYPHGCLEQTTSAAFPQVFLPRLSDLDAAHLTAIRTNVQAAIDRMRDFRTADGGFGYWPGEGSHPWATTYAGHFLLEAERAGFVLPAGVRGGWVKAQRLHAARWTASDPQSELDQAYRLYTLALAGEPEIGAMNRLRGSASLPLAARWRLAAAYKLAGQPEVARALVERQATDVPKYTELSGTFGTDLRDEAMILETLVLLGHDPQETLAVARRASDALAAGEPLPTQTAAYLLIALARFGEMAGPQGTIDATVTPPGGTPVKVASAKVLASIPLPAEGRGSIAVANHGAGPLFVRVVTTGVPPVGDERAAANGLTVHIAYAGADSGARLDPAALPAGTDLRAEVTVRNTSPMRLEELALTQILPSGWELHGTAPGPGPGYEYRDVRDDRVMTYFDLGIQESRTFVWTVHASYAGRYYMGPVVVEAMYDPLRQARTAGQWIEVSSEAGQM